LSDKVEGGAGRLCHPTWQEHARVVRLHDDVHGFTAKPLPPDDGQPATVTRMKSVMNSDLSRLWMGSM
jgi:hypothetical protein